MPQLNFPQQSVNVPTGVPQQNQSFQGFQDLASGLLNLGKAQQEGRAAAERQRRVAAGYDLYRQYADEFTKGLHGLQLQEADPATRGDRGNEFIQRTQEAYMQIAAEQGIADEFLKHAVPYTITRQDKFLTETHNQIHDHALGMLDAEGESMIQQVVNDGVGFVIETPGGVGIQFNDDTHEIMGVELSAYYDLIATTEGLSVAEKNKLITEKGNKLVREVAKKAILADPEGFLVVDPTKELTVDLPLFDVDGGFRSFTMVMTQEDITKLRDEAYDALTKQHGLENYHQEQAKQAKTQYSEFIQNEVTKALEAGSSPDVTFAIISSAEARMDLGMSAQLRRQVIDYYNARAGSPNEPPDPRESALQERILVEGVTGPNSVTIPELFDMFEVFGFSQAQRSRVMQTYASQADKAQTRAQAQMAEQAKFARERFSSIVRGDNPLIPSLNIPVSSLDRLDTEMQQFMSMGFHQLPEQQRTYENILKVSYDAQVQAIKAVFADAAEKMEPEHRAALGRMINSKLPRNKPDSMSFPEWITHNVMAGTITRAEAIPLHFMTTLYDINTEEPQSGQALEAQRPELTTFPEYERIKQMDETGKTTLETLNKELEHWTERGRRAQEKLDKQVKELNKGSN